MCAVLHVISDRKRHSLPLFDALLLSARAGADVIQIREKKAPSLETYQLCESLMQACANEGLNSQVFVNDRVDVALSLPTAGVHLAAKSLPIAKVVHLRSRIGWTGQIGCSVHSLEEAKAAQEAGADYVTFGHVFASSSHSGIPPKGLSALYQVVEELSIPVIAIGGIDATNIASVLATGCTGVAVIGAVLESERPLAAVQTLKEKLKQHSGKEKVSWITRGLKA
ncbi:thiamine phosphate synthase [Sulfoacidibacillus thermotolerans]|uniref:Thiamine-phosphate synthase n=1 Tax=Sulfoacidibacillus thermotolerans TaxID=1765684 RepID=A0A2U3D6J7_SULT2|nr:thiamine phosphate synthase [Sulfoacidibacillus thermotolerans]PWI56910.1 thiamine phosphate synthase [Sulfoacidibacillus thermotolerans]